MDFLSVSTKAREAQASFAPFGRAFGGDFLFEVSRIIEINAETYYRFCEGCDFGVFDGPDDDLIGYAAVRAGYPFEWGAIGLGYGHAQGPGRVDGRDLGGWGPHVWFRYGDSQNIHTEIGIGTILSRSLRVGADDSISPSVALYSSAHIPLPIGPDHTQVSFVLRLNAFVGSPQLWMGTVAVHVQHYWFVWGVDVTVFANKISGQINLGIEFSGQL